ncbi:MAG: hypothetical protein XU14_C0009G0022 [Armatimonadetes bacterium CSP1-3]|nr:MAG: hypothetical protein XU14_C0009G0022 [Armatimonadetes bacterium CSP1-3]
MNRRMIIFLVLVLIWGGPKALGILTDWLWFTDLGFAGVYRTRLLAQVTLFILGAAGGLGLVWGSAVLATRLSRQAIGAPHLIGSGLLNERQFAVTVAGGSLVVGFMLAAGFSGQWDQILRFLRPTAFGAADPLFGRDIAFFVFALPVYRFLQGWLLTVVLLALLAGIAVYAFRLVLPQLPTRTDEETEPWSPASLRLVLSRPMKAHLFGLGAALFLLLAWGYRLSVYELVYSPRGAAFGAGYADIHARLPALWFLVALSVLAAALLLVGIRRPGVRLATTAAGAWVGAAILVGGIYPAVIQRLIVQPQELERERPYIERTIRLTRQAFALDRIAETVAVGEEMVTAEEIAQRPATIGNIRLWDPEPLLTTYNQIQSIRLYYDFVSIDVDRYTIDGRYRQVMLGARELAPQRLPAQAQTWVNRRLQFTHGYGVAMSAVNEVTPEGLPTFFLQDVPPRGKIPIDQPELYFSERATDYVIVRTRFPEFSYPKGDENVYTTYAGKTGVHIGSLSRRLLFAWRFRDLNILLTDAITSRSVILYHRNVRERVARLAPFLRLDSDPYVVVADGRLFWILDAYTQSNRYPYAQPHRERFNYLRNSVKAVVDAYHGTVTLYVAEPADPLIRTYARIFPRLLRPLAELPASLRAHLRYPQDLFAAQAEMYRLFHMQDPRVFYNKEDVWVLPEEIYIDKPREMAPYYVIMRLPDAPREEFMLILPYTPPGKQNMITWLAARSDGQGYGKLLAFRYPKDKLIFGPMQIEARLNQDPAISEQFTLWSQGGNRVIRGNMIVIPIGQSNLYVEPIYLQAEQGRLPEMKRVILASGNRLAMESTVSAALRGLYAAPEVRRPAAGRAPAAAAAPSDAGLDPASLLRAVQARQARIQEELRALEADLQRLLRLLEQKR